MSDLLAKIRYAQMRAAEDVVVANLPKELRTKAPSPPVELPVAAWPKVTGVGRDAENSRVLIVYFRQTPTDTELRSFHEAIAATKGQP